MPPKRTDIARRGEIARTYLALDCEVRGHGVGRPVLVKVADGSVDRDVPAPVGNKRIRSRNIVRGNSHGKLLCVLSAGQRADERLRELRRLGTEVREAVRRIPCRVRNRQPFDDGKESPRAYANTGLARTAGELRQQTVGPAG